MLKSHPVPPMNPGAFSGTWSPTFHPNRCIVFTPTMTPWRSARNAFHSCGSTLYSGYMRIQSSGSMANCAKKFFGSW